MTSNQGTMSYNVGKNSVFLEDVLPYYMLLKISYPLMDFDAAKTQMNIQISPPKE